MTPLAINMILHFNITTIPYSGMEMEPQQEAIKSFIDDGILFDCGTNDIIYKITEKGRKWIEMILKTPYPEKIWVDPRDSKEI